MGRPAATSAALSELERVGCFVYRVGCQHVAVRAELLGQGTVLRRSRVLPFACGE